MDPNFSHLKDKPILNIKTKTKFTVTGLIAMTYLKIQNTEVFKKQRLPVSGPTCKELGHCHSVQTSKNLTGKQTSLLGSITQGRTQGKPLPAKLENQMG